MTLSVCVLFLKGYRYFHISHYVFLHIRLCVSISHYVFPHIPLRVFTYPTMCSHLSYYVAVLVEQAPCRLKCARTQPSSWHCQRGR